MKPQIQWLRVFVKGVVIGGRAHRARGDDVRTTMTYVGAITDAGIGMRSPLDRPDERD